MKSKKKGAVVCEWLLGARVRTLSLPVPVLAHLSVHHRSPNSANWICSLLLFFLFFSLYNLKLHFDGNAVEIRKWTGRLVCRSHHLYRQGSVRQLLQTRRHLRLRLRSLLHLLRRTSSGMFKPPSSATALSVRLLSLPIRRFNNPFINCISNFRSWNLGSYVSLNLYSSLVISVKFMKFGDWRLLIDGFSEIELSFLWIW